MNEQEGREWFRKVAENFIREERLIVKTPGLLPPGFEKTLLRKIRQKVRSWDTTMVVEAIVYGRSWTHSGKQSLFNVSDMCVRMGGEEILCRLASLCFFAEIIDALKEGLSREGEQIVREA